MPSPLPIARAVGTDLEGQGLEVPPLAGRVDFGRRTVQTNLSDVGQAATVSLINTGTNRTEATTLTNNAGQFALTLTKGFRPDPTATYYMEAIKGLNSNLPSRDAARVRTIVKFQDGYWVTLTSLLPGAGIVIGRSSTALSIGAALKAGTASPVDFNALIGSVEVGTPDTYHPVANLSQADFASLSALVDQILAAERDPVATIAYDASSGTWNRIPQGGFSYTGITPASASVGTSVTLSGTGFGATTGENTVRFNGVAGTVTGAGATSLTVTVPSGATSGQTTVQVGNLIALGPNLTVNVVISSFTPTSGGASTSVTIAGSGFSATPGQNVVKFNGVAGTVTSASGTSLVVTAPTSTTGPLSVTVAGVTGTSASNFTYVVPMIAALYEPVMNAGTLKLEGNFGATAQVNFPGGVSVPATVLGSNRAEVSLPAGATAGNLTVTTNSTTTNALPFRRTSFTPGLFQFNPNHEQPRQMPTLVTARKAPTSAVIGNYLYVIGGYSLSSQYISSAERAVINADGTLGAFATVPGVNLVTPRAYHTSTVLGNYLYVIGGENAANPVSSVERATINPADGSIGNFATVAGVSLGTARKAPTSAVIGNYLYVIGGWDGGSHLSSLERATINGDGTIGNFSTVSGVSLNTRRGFHTSAVIGNYLYVMGGYSDVVQNSLSSVERAPINPDGSIGNFANVAGVSLGTARDSHTSAVIGNYLYVLGGTVNSVVRAAINPDGSIGNFATIAGVSLATARTGHASAVIGNYLYAVGGYGGSYLASVERAAITPAGTLGNFGTVAGVTLVTGRYFHTSAVAGKYLYVMGGWDGVAANPFKDVERAAINPDGTLGAFSASGLMTMTRQGPASAVIGNYLYVLGGSRYSGGTWLTTVERATINSDGTLGAFAAVAGATLVTARRYFNCVVIGNYLYVIGGEATGNVALNSVERATINPADGSISTFSAVGTLSMNRRAATSNVIGNYLYVVGGWDGSGYQTSVDRAVINSDGTIGAFSTVAGVSLAAGRTESTSAVIGNYLYVIGGWVSGNMKSIERAIINTDGTLGNFSAAGNIPTIREDYTSAVIGNYVYLIGGYDGSSVNSVDRATLQ